MNTEEKVINYLKELPKFKVYKVSDISNELGVNYSTISRVNSHGGKSYNGELPIVAVTVRSFLYKYKKYIIENELTLKDVVNLSGLNEKSIISSNLTKDGEPIIPSLRKSRFIREQTHHIQIKKWVDSKEYFTISELYKGTGIYIDLLYSLISDTENSQSSKIIQNNFKELTGTSIKKYIEKKLIRKNNYRLKEEEIKISINILTEYKDKIKSLSEIQTLFPCSYNTIVTTNNGNLIYNGKPIKEGLFKNLEFPIFKQKEKITSNPIMVKWVIDDLLNHNLHGKYFSSLARYLTDKSVADERFKKYYENYSKDEIYKSIVSLISSINIGKIHKLEGVKYPIIDKHSKKYKRDSENQRRFTQQRPTIERFLEIIFTEKTGPAKDIIKQVISEFDNVTPSQVRLYYNPNNPYIINFYNEIGLKLPLVKPNYSDNRTEYEKYKAIKNK